MTIQRNLAGLIPEAARRTIEELDLRLTKLQAMITAMAQAAANNNGGGLTAKQQSDVLALVAGRSSSVIGQEAVDPLVTGLAGGSVTSFSAGDLSPLFTTTETNVNTTPALAFAQIVQNANLFFAGPASGGAANPTFRAPVAADLPPLNIVKLTFADSPYAVTDANDVILVDATGGVVKIDLPDVTTARQKPYYFKKLDASVNDIQINGTGGDAIDGAATRSINTQYGVLVIIPENAGTDWGIFAQI